MYQTSEPNPWPARVLELERARESAQVTHQFQRATGATSKSVFCSCFLLLFVVIFFSLAAAAAVVPF